MLKKMCWFKKKVTCAHYPDIKNQKICGINQTFKKKCCFAKMQLPRDRSHWRTGSQFEELTVPNVRTNASQSWNQGFPPRGTAGSQTFESMLPNLGTTGSEFKELMVSNIGTTASESSNHGLQARKLDFFGSLWY